MRVVCLLDDFAAFPQYSTGAVYGRAGCLRRNKCGRSAAEGLRRVQRRRRDSACALRAGARRRRARAVRRVLGARAAARRRARCRRARLSRQACRNLSRPGAARRLGQAARQARAMGALRARARPARSARPRASLLRLGRAARARRCGSRGRGEIHVARAGRSARRLPAAGRQARRARRDPCERRLAARADAVRARPDHRGQERARLSAARSRRRTSCCSRRRRRSRNRCWRTCRVISGGAPRAKWPCSRRCGLQPRILVSRPRRSRARSCAGCTQRTAPICGAASRSRARARTTTRRSTGTPSWAARRSPTTWRPGRRAPGCAAATGRRCATRSTPCPGRTAAKRCGSTGMGARSRHRANPRRRAPTISAFPARPISTACSPPKSSVRRRRSRRRPTCRPRRRWRRRAAFRVSRARSSSTGSACAPRPRMNGCSRSAAWATGNCLPPPSWRGAKACTTAPSIPRT